MVQAENKSARETEFSEWINTFVTDYKGQKKADNIVVVADAAKILNEIYWHQLETYVRPIVEGSEAENRINRFKIISTIELTIVTVLPILVNVPDDTSDTFDENELVRRVNAEFAWFIAITILCSWYNSVYKSIPDEGTMQKIANYKDALNPTHIELSTVKDEHIKWLTYLNRDTSLPLFSNSQFWRMFELSLLIESKKV